MKRSGELIPFTEKPLVPAGKRGGRFQYWKQERKIQALESDIKEYGKVLARLSEELIEELIFLQRPNEPEPEEKARRLSEIMGALKRERGLLNGLLTLGFDLHPVLMDRYLKKATAELGAPKPPEIEALLIEAPDVAVHGIVESCPSLFTLLTPQEMKIATLQLLRYKAPEIAKRLGIAVETVYEYGSKIREKARSIIDKEGDHLEGSD